MWVQVFHQMICKNKEKSLEKTARKPKYKYKSSGGMGHEKKLKRKRGEALKNQTPEKDILPQNQNK